MSGAVEQRFEAHGMTCEVYAGTIGFRCGYVEIPKGHPLFGLSYGDEAPGVTWESLEGQPIGKRGVISLMLAGGRKTGPQLDIAFDVHGSLTFGGPRHTKDDWWLGFDCGHVGDAKDPALMSDSVRSIFERMGDEGVARTREYVAEQCRSLAEQIAKLYPLPEVAP